MAVDFHRDSLSAAERHKLDSEAAMSMFGTGMEDGCVSDEMFLNNSLEDQSLTRLLAFGSEQAHYREDGMGVHIFKLIMQNVLAVFLFGSILVFAVVEVGYWNKSVDLETHMRALMERCNCSSLPDCICDGYHRVQYDNSAWLSFSDPFHAPIPC